PSTARFCASIGHYMDGHGRPPPGMAGWTTEPVQRCPMPSKVKGSRQHRRRSVTTPTAQPFHSATQAFADGTDTPRDFLERCLLRLDEYEPNIAAFVHFNREGARAAADRSSER